MIYFSLNLAKNGPICEKTYPQKLVTWGSPPPSSDIVATFALFLILRLPLAYLFVVVGDIWGYLGLGNHEVQYLDPVLASSHITLSLLLPAPSPTSSPASSPASSFAPSLVSSPA